MRSVMMGVVAGERLYSSAAFTLLASGYSDSSVGGSIPQTFDTTGATLFVAVLVAIGIENIQDSETNTWHYLTNQVQVNNVNVRIAYAYGVTTNASHTFTITGQANQTGFIYIFGGTGPTTSSCFTGENGTVTTTASLQPGSVTPAVGGIVVTGFGGLTNDATGSTIDSGFATPILATANLQGGGSYLLSLGTSPVNPTWTMGGAGSTASVIAAFIPA